MERLLPDVADVDVDEVYADLVVPAGIARPHVYLGMVASADGAAAVGGSSGALGGAADGAAFRRLRETCDVILAGAETVRVEDYRPPPLRPGSAERRLARGLAERPRIAVVTGSGRLDPHARLFSDPDQPPLVLTTDTAEVGHLEDRAEVVRCGVASVDLAGALRQLWDRGVRRVLCEGGPRLNGELLTADLVDELFLTVAPTLVGTDAPRVVAGRIGPARDLELVALHHHAGELLLRYRVVRPGGRASSSGRV